MYLGDHLIYALLSLLVGGALSYLLRGRRTTFPVAIFRAVIGLRALVLGVIFFLLLSPSFECTRTVRHPPVVVFALDNSQSVLLSGDSLSTRKELGLLYEGLRKWARRREVSLRCHSMSGYREMACPTREGWPAVPFNGDTSDLSRLITGATEIHNHLAGIVLASDGIFNQGVSPAHLSFAKRVFCVGLGDPEPKKDIVLRPLKYNRKVQVGNQFLIEAEITQTGYEEGALEVVLKKEKAVHAQKKVALPTQKGGAKVSFLVTADKKGIHQYDVYVRPRKGEITENNNHRRAYVEAVQEKISLLILAEAPHPDIGALRVAATQKGEREVRLQIISTEKAKAPKRPYNAIIWYDAFSSRAATEAYRRLTKDKKIPTWFFITTRSKPSWSRKLPLAFSWQKNGQQTVPVTPGYNRDFSAFRFSDSLAEKIQSYPVVFAPNVGIRSPFALHTIFYQKIDGIRTSEPLWLLGTGNNQRMALSVGSGCWRWRVQEHTKYSQYENFDEIISKVVQYLSAYSEREKFSLRPTRAIFSEGEAVSFRTTIYNELHQLSFGQEVALEIETSNHKDHHVYLHRQEDFEIPFLPAGAYRYTAHTLLQGKKEHVQGKFSVAPFSLEGNVLTARFEPLQRLAQNTDGHFTVLAQWEQLLEKMNDWEIEENITQNKHPFSLLDVVILLVGVVLLLLVEWFLRIRNGKG